MQSGNVEGAHHMVHYPKDGAWVHVSLTLFLVQWGGAASCEGGGGAYTPHNMLCRTY